MADTEKCSPDTNCQTCGSAGACDADTQRKHMEDRLQKSLSAIHHRISVMSGKGGVGKSTVAVNLAVALASMGKKVGILDADVHGPNVPTMLGLEGRRPEGGPEGLVPLVAENGLKVMSMAFLIQGRDTPVAWRGPMKHSLFQQFLADVRWGELDYLIVDLPPGTGDEPMSIAQILGPPLWAVIVTTPQDVALLDSRKSVVFAQNVEMNVLGVVENMSGFSCPHCGEKIDLFKTGGGEKAAFELAVPFLGRIPIDPRVVGGGDAGTPILSLDPEAPSSNAIREIAKTIDNRVSQTHDAAVG